MYPSLSISSIFNRSLGLKTKQKTRRQTINFKKIVSCIIILGILPSLFLYAFLIGKIAQQSFLIKQQEEVLKRLSDEKVNLLSQANLLFTLERVEKKSEALNFVKVSKIKYIPISSEHLAKNPISLLKKNSR